MENPSQISRLHFPSHADLRYRFDDGDPFIHVKYGEDTHTVTFDPCPCYTHDPVVIASEIAQIEAKAPLKHLPSYFVFPFEGRSRCNGWANESFFYKEGGVKEPRFWIGFDGKRIPILPAMTRYLVAHEFGHIVHYNINFLKEFNRGEFDKEYAAFRGCLPGDGYGPQRWHTSIGEIIANDIRIALFGKEEDFWPHPCSRPDERIREFWESQLKTLCLTS